MNPNFMGWQGQPNPYMYQYQTMPPGSYQQFQPEEPAPPKPLRVKLTPKERGLYNLLLSQVDPQDKQQIEGSTIVEFLKRSSLPVDVLKEIWNICTPNNETFLDKDRFYCALRLVGLAQSGKPVSAEAIYNDEQGPLPKFQSTGPKPDFWSMPEADKSKYHQMFEQLSAGAPELQTQQAMQVMMQTKADQGMLSRIWDLCDVNQTGTFNTNQFAVMMHLLYMLIEKKEPPPNELPPSLKTVINEPVHYPEPLEPPQSSGFQEFQPSPQKAQTFEPTEKELFAEFDTFEPFPSQKASPPKSSVPKIPPPKSSPKEPASSEFKSPPLSYRSSQDSARTFSQDFKTKVTISVRKQNNFSENKVKADEDCTEELKKVEEELQKVMREWQALRQKLSLQRERNQMLSSRLQDISSKTIKDTCEATVSFFKQNLPKNNS